MMFPHGDTVADPSATDRAARGAAAYRRRLTPKQMEAEVFARAARAIRAAEGGSPVDRARALADNRRLWNAVHGAVADPANALPPGLRGAILGLSHAVVRECDAEEPDLPFLAETNDQIVGGLWN